MPVLSLPPYYCRRTEKKCCQSSTFLLSQGLCEEDVIQLICCALIHGGGAAVAKIMEPVVVLFCVSGVAAGLCVPGYEPKRRITGELQGNAVCGRRSDRRSWVWGGSFTSRSDNAFYEFHRNIGAAETIFFFSTHIWVT